MRLEAALLSGLFTGQLCSALSNGIDNVVHHALHHRHADFHDHLRREADAVVHQREKRNDVFDAPGGVWPTVVVPAGFTLAGGVQITPVPGASSTSNVPANVTPTSAPVQAQAQQAGDVPAVAKSVNSTQWSAEAANSCMTAVMSLKGNSSNPAGLAVCYNVPYLDSEKGVFEAELRMYNISAPSGDFVGITPSMMMVTLSYNGATIQKSDGQAPAKRDLVERQQLTAPTGPAIVGGPTGEMPNGLPMPIEVAVRQYVGQVNKDLMQQGMSLDDYRVLLVPQISISGTNPASAQNVKTVLSSTESSFNAGVFAQTAGNTTDPQKLLGNPQEQIAAAAQGIPTPYDIPGLALGVFPTGLIITSIWMVLFVGVVGAGTVGRMQFRDQYRQAVRAQKEGSQRRI